jgi:hypothetical protein
MRVEPSLQQHQLEQTVVQRDWVEVMPLVVHRVQVQWEQPVEQVVLVQLRMLLVLQL